MLSQEEFEKRISITFNDTIEILSDYKGKRKDIELKCKKCGYQWNVVAQNAMYGKQRNCPECEIDKKKTGDSIVCANCGKKIYRVKSKMSKSKSGLYFCNRNCSSTYFNHSSNIVSINNYRDKAIDYYGAKCELCGDNEDIRLLDVHHIDENRCNNEINNLIVLCVKCHAKITRGIDKLIDRTLIINEDNIDKNNSVHCKPETVHKKYCKINCYDKTDNLIKSFNKMSDALDWLKQFYQNPSSTHIIECILHKRKSAYNYIWVGVTINKKILTAI